MLLSLPVQNKILRDDERSDPTNELESNSDGGVDRDDRESSDHHRDLLDHVEEDTQSPQP
jgi:hypothetical protein